MMDKELDSSAFASNLIVFYEIGSDNRSFMFERNVSFTM